MAMTAQELHTMMNALQQSQTIALEALQAQQAAAMAQQQTVAIAAAANWPLLY